MIQKISFQNYKAFEKGEIKLKPITILLGANSVGKSSIINLLLMLQQTANSTKYKSALRLHGENVSMGECKNIFRNQDTSQNIVIDFEFKSGEWKGFLTEILFKDFVEQIGNPIRYFFRFLEKDIDNPIKQFVDKRGELSPTVYSSKESFMQLINAIEVISKITNYKQTNIIKYYTRRIKKLTPNDKKSLEKIYDFLSDIKNNIKDDIFNLSFECCHVKSDNEDVIKINNVILKNSTKQILNLNFELNNNNSAYNNIVIKSDFNNGEELLDDKAKEDFLKSINHNSTIFSWMPHYNSNGGFFFRSLDDVLFSKHIDDYEYSIITKIIAQIIGSSIAAVKEQFTRGLINHVSPIRAHPKRYYFLDKANINTVLDPLDGNSLTEILKEDATVREQVNSWLETFGLHVDVLTLLDNLHKLKIKQNSLDYDITDVGFGISQILPVIVQGFLSFEHSLTMIEQPEIHLHPKMQADLADLFIDIVNGSPARKQASKPNKYLLIETHSEYLLHRLRRRISEGKISAQDVAIYFVAPRKDENTSSEIQEKEVFEDGAFEWPQDFYEGELKEDKNVFIKQLFNRK
jgi:predicted ATPase